MVERTVLDARCHVCGHLISGPVTIYTDKGSAHPTCVNCSPHAEARIAELEAEVDRLRTLVMAQSRAIHSPEAISRTGAVNDGLRRADEIVRTHPMRFAGCTEEHVRESLSQAILSALEPSAPEGQQPVAYRWALKSGPEGWCYGGPYTKKTPGMARIEPLYTRPSEQAVTEATHRHKRRGTEYVLIGYGRMQAEDWGDQSKPDPHSDYFPSIDMREVAIYRSVDDGNLWVRPREEFEDGRFEALKAAMEAGR